MWRVTPHHKWRVVPLHINFEEWLLPTSNVKRDSSSYQMWRVWLLSTWNVKGDSFPQQMWSVTPLLMWRETPLNFRCEECLLSTGSDSSLHKSVSSPHQMWRVTPPHRMWWVTPLHIRLEESLLSTTNEKSECSLRPYWRVTPSDSSPLQMWRVT
jgi:uncharacterized protein with PIN domain